MLKSIFSMIFLNLQIIKFDTQDNIVQIGCEWKQNLNLDNFEPLQDYGLIRQDKKLFFKTKVPVKSIRLNKFKQRYKVKKHGSQLFEIKCVNLQKHFDETDIVEVVVNE